MKFYDRAREKHIVRQQEEQGVAEVDWEKIIEQKRRAGIELSADERLKLKIWMTNEGLKRINGHSPEYVAEHFGVPVEELFPPDGTAVYIGDPWQKLDRKGVTIVDYEFGPIAEFQDDKEAYLAVLDSRISSIEFSDLGYKDPLVSAFLQRELRLARELYEQARTASLEAYEQISTDFLRMRERIENEIERETAGQQHDPLYALDGHVRDLWYTAVHGARLVDVFDWATELEPVYREFAQSLPEDMPEAARDLKLKEKRRLWSISTYALEHLTDEELGNYWKEIFCVLAPRGRAYIAPLFGEDGEGDVTMTLDAFSSEHSDFTFSFDDPAYPNKLMIEKGASN